MRTAALMLTALLTTTAPAEQGPAELTQEQIVGKLLESFGLDQWDRIESMRFVFNVDREDKPGIRREWQWSPKTGQVTARYDDADGMPVEVTYMRYKVGDGSPAAIKQADRHFVNDSFWLLLPLHLSWAGDVTITDGPVTLGPLKRHIAREVTVKYPGDSGGYTPGDVYKLYVDDGWRILQWSYHRGGADAASLATIWSQDKQVGPLKLTTDFVNPETKFRLYFTGLAVKLVDEDDWHSAQVIGHGCRTCP